MSAPTLPSPISIFRPNLDEGEKDEMPHDNAAAREAANYHAAPPEAYHAAEPLGADFEIVATQPAADPDFETTSRP